MDPHPESSTVSQKTQIPPLKTCVTPSNPISTSSSVKKAPLESVCLDDIVFKKLIGYGSHGDVYFATINEHPYAIKVIRRKKLYGAIIADAIPPEIAKQIRLQHPNVLRIHSVKYKRGNYLVVMELMKENLRARLKRSPLTIPMIMKIAKEVALALHYLHTSASPYPIVHFDVRTSNVLIPFDDSQPCKLGDFGLAAHFTSSNPNELQQQSHSQKYPPLYSAPEVLQRKFCPASDIYSYGILLWELVERKEPRDFLNRQFTDTKEMENWILESGEFKLPLPPERQPHPHYPELPYSYFELIKLCWEKDPQKRPTAAQILNYLDFICHQLAQRNPDYSSLYGVHLMEAVQRGLLENLKVFFEKHSPSDRIQKSARKICKPLVHGVEFYGEYGPASQGLVFLPHLAARQGNIELLEYFSELQPLPRGLGFVAACHHRLNVLDYLLYSGYTLGNEVLLGALLGGHVDIIHWAKLELGVQPQQFFSKNLNLFSTILASHPSLSVELWEEVQSYRLVSPSLNCFLWGIAIGNGNVILAKKLMESNLFTVEDIKKLTQPSNVLPILMQAVLSNSPETVELLVKNLDRSILTQQKLGIDALHLCCYTGNVTILKLLLDNGFNPNAQYGRGTPLYFAKETRQSELEKELRKRGAIEEGPINVLNVENDKQEIPG